VAEPRPGELDATAAAFAALGDPTRLELVRRLADGEARSMARLGDGLALSRQAVTRHLRVLEAAGVVRTTRVGRERQVALEPGPVRDLRAFLDHAARRWDAALDRLRTHLGE
jgi:DNA-binding transcriptional ArsR family regulator